MFDQTFENIIKHRIGRQRILIGLIGPELGRGRLVDDVDRDHFTRRSERTGRHMAVAPARQRIDLHLVQILDRVEAAIHVAVERGVANRHFALVAGGHHHRAELVGDCHQDDATRPALQVFLGDPFISALEHVAQNREKALHRLLDRHCVIATAQCFGAGLGVFDRGFRGVAVRQHDRAQPLLAQRIDGECGADCRINTARQTDHHVAEAVLVDVITQAQHAGAVIRLLALGNHRHRSFRTGPAAIVLALPDGEADRLLELAHLEGEALV